RIVHLILSLRLPRQPVNMKSVLFLAWNRSVHRLSLPKPWSSAAFQGHRGRYQETLWTSVLLAFGRTPDRWSTKSRQNPTKLCRHRIPPRRESPHCVRNYCYLPKGLQTLPFCERHLVLHNS